MNEVLLIGDSIRMHYQKRVAELLGDSCNVSYPTENCRFSIYTHNSLRLWLPTFPKPDIIHWNNGLWDTAVINGENEPCIPLEIYTVYLKKTLAVLKNTGAKIIFATTTPCDPRKETAQPGMTSIHRNSDIERYNEAATEIMKSENVIINDLYSLVAPNIDKYISEDMIHPSNYGTELLANCVADKIKSVL